MELKIGRKIFMITAEDVVVCYAGKIKLMTQNYLVKFNKVYPQLSQTLFKNLLKYDALYLVKEEGCTQWYKFNLVNLEHYLRAFNSK